MQHKMECPTWRTNLSDLYQTPVLEDAYDQEMFRDSDQYLYAEDLANIREAQNKVTTELDSYEKLLSKFSKLT